MKACLETTSMFCSREKLIGLNVIQQNEKSIQGFKRILWIRGLGIIAVKGERCNKGMQLQEPQKICFEMYKQGHGTG